MSGYHHVASHVSPCRIREAGGDTFLQLACTSAALAAKREALPIPHSQFTYLKHCACTRHLGSGRLCLPFTRYSALFKFDRRPFLRERPYGRAPSRPLIRRTNPHAVRLLKIRTSTLVCLPTPGKRPEAHTSSPTSFSSHAPTISLAAHR